MSAQNRYTPPEVKTRTGLHTVQQAGAHSPKVLSDQSQMGGYQDTCLEDILNGWSLP